MNCTGQKSFIIIYICFQGVVRLSEVCHFFRAVPGNRLSRFSQQRIRLSLIFRLFDTPIYTLL